MSVGGHAEAQPGQSHAAAAQAAFHILWMLSFCHLLNDMKIGRVHV